MDWIEKGRSINRKAGGVSEPQRRGSKLLEPRLIMIPGKEIRRKEEVQGTAGKPEGPFIV